jgi:hypothetical protein
MRDGIGDPRWRVPLGNLEQRAVLVRELQRECKIGFALLRGQLQPLAEDHALEREATGRKDPDIACLPAE